MAKYKYFIFSDIHGCYDYFISSLEKAGFNIDNKSHILVGAGDYFDRGDQNAEIYTFFTSKKLKGRIYLVKGNHDGMLFDFLRGFDDGLFNSLYNGMWTTIQSFSKKTFSLEVMQLYSELYIQDIDKYYPKLRNWLQTTLKRGFQIDHYRITHAGLGMGSEDDKSKLNIDNWNDTPYFVKNYKPDGYIYVFGHWFARLLCKEVDMEVSDETFKYKYFVGLDACTQLSHFVNIYTIESDQLPTIL